MGGTWGRGLPILMAGRDFGDTILERESKKPKPGWSRRTSRNYHSGGGHHRAHYRGHKWSFF